MRWSFKPGNPSSTANQTAVMKIGEIIHIINNFQHV